jgi:hypothetical protein
VVFTHELAVHEVLDSSFDIHCVITWTSTVPIGICTPTSASALYFNTVLSTYPLIADGLSFLI